MKKEQTSIKTFFTFEHNVFCENFLLYICIRMSFVKTFFCIYGYVCIIMYIYIYHLYIYGYQIIIEGIKCTSTQKLQHYLFRTII